MRDLTYRIRLHIMSLQTISIIYIRYAIGGTDWITCFGRDDMRSDSLWETETFSLTARILMIALFLMVIVLGAFSLSCSLTSPPWKLPNPSLTVTLDRIGVLSDHDPFILGAGDIYLYVGITDGKGQPQTQRIPATGVIKLKDNEMKEIGQQLFATSCVGDELRIVAVAFESDSGTGLLRLVLNALVPYLSGTAGASATLIRTLLNSTPSSEDGCPQGVTAESPDDDFVGAIEQVWTSSQNWGIGSHNDVRSGDLRLWFTISTQGGSSLKSQPSPTASPSMPTPAPVQTPPSQSPPPTTTPQPKPFMVNFNGWYVDGVNVATTTKGRTVTARVTISGGNPGQYTIRIMRAISSAPDQPVKTLSFSYEAIPVTKELTFTISYATGESSTQGYHLDVLKDGHSVYSLPNFYPPRLQVKKQ